MSIRNAYVKIDRGKVTVTHSFSAIDRLDEVVWTFEDVPGGLKPVIRIAAAAAVQPPEIPAILSGGQWQARSQIDGPAPAGAGRPLTTTYTLKWESDGTAPISSLLATPVLDTDPTLVIDHCGDPPGGPTGHGHPGGHGSGDSSGGGQ